MTIRERILSVYNGKTPDLVPFMLDLSHYFYHKNKIPWDLSNTYEEPEYELIDYHKKLGVGIFNSHLGLFYKEKYDKNVLYKVEKKICNDKTEIIWSYETPLGIIKRTRIWDESTYSWAIKEWGVKTVQDLKILGFALSNRKYEPNWESFDAWKNYVGDYGVIYMLLLYTGLGNLLCRWMGIEETVYAAYEKPDLIREIIDQINENTLNLVDLLCKSPAEVIFIGDNISGDIQSPNFFNKWSKEFYIEAIRRLHLAKKFVAVHIDGKLHGALKMIKDTGADCADSVTPAPMGDLTPEECRKETGNDFILSGGPPPNLWLPEASIDVFKKSVMDWLKLKKYSSRFIATAGDQVPPLADEDRIKIMRELIDKYGKY